MTSEITQHFIILIWTQIVTSRIETLNCDISKNFPRLAFLILNFSILILVIK